MSGLYIRNLKLANVGTLRGTVDLGAFDPGITLITGENETGKTTTVEALRWTLFGRHNAKAQGIRALHARDEIFRNKVTVPPVPFWPPAILGQLSSKCALIKGYSRDDGHIHFGAGRE